MRRVAASLLALATLAKPAEAAFPGVNGKIVFQSSRITADNPQGDYEIFSINQDGTGVKQLTFNNRDDREPAFSRLGARIAFVSNRDGNYEIYRSPTARNRPASPSRRRKIPSPSSRPTTRRSPSGATGTATKRST